MDGSWALPLKSTTDSANNDALRHDFLAIFPEHKPLSNNDFMIEQARGLSCELIRKQSYCPATWTARAYNLLRLGLPDLAVGDAYKAKILLEIYDSQEHPLKAAVTKALWRQTKESLLPTTSSHKTTRDRATRLREYVYHMSDRSSMVFAQALFLANCFVECYEFLKHYVPRGYSTSDKFDRLKELAERAQIIEDMSRLEENDFVSNRDQDSQEGRRSGSILPQVYPWSTPYLNRSERILNVAKMNMRGVTKFTCYIDNSNIVDDLATKNVVEKEAQTMGIKANKDFPQGELLLVDRTFLSGVDNHTGRCTCCNGLFAPHQLQEYEAKCCDACFCGPMCKELSKHYHFIVCRRQRDLTRDPAMMLNSANVSPDTIAANDLLYRIFAHLENYPAFHPLRTPTIGSMIPAYRNASPVRFSWTNDIKRPFAMLGALGIDIFKDHGFDTWVIQTIQARIRNNIRAFEDEWGQYHVAINLLYMFFNHSCDPNVEIINHWSGSSHLFAKATKDIKRKDELFISYIASEDLALPYADRQVLLKDWTGGECQCQRCRHERDDAAKPPEMHSTASISPIDAQSLDGFYTQDYEYDTALDLPAGHYIGDHSLLEIHPAIQSLERTNLFHEHLLDPFDYESDIDCGESPTRKKPRHG